MGAGTFDIMDKHRQAFVKCAFVFQITMLVLYATCATFSDDLSPNHTLQTAGEILVQDYYPFFQDVHVMIFVGFGFLMTFLNKYGYSAVSYNFVISAMTIQWSMLVLGFWHNVHDHEDSPWSKVELDITYLIRGDFAAAAVMITFGALIGKVSPVQMLVIMLLEIVLYALNEMIGSLTLHAVDMGGSMYVHMFGAYFGLAVSWVMTRPAQNPEVSKKNSGGGNADMFAMIGTLFLWMYWPSFNGALAGGTAQHRVVVNTVLALSASCTAAFFTDAFLQRRRGKFSMVSIQNATLAGGVAVGSSSDLVADPWGALLVGMCAGMLSVYGYVHIQPFLEKKIGLSDTCGVHNLHGLPGLMGGLGGVISAAIVGDEKYGSEISTMFPARAKDGLNWSAMTQAQHQFYALLTTLAIAIVGGLAVGTLMKVLPTVPEEYWYDDDHGWIMEDNDEDDVDAEQGRPSQAQLMPHTHSTGAKTIEHVRFSEEVQLTGLTRI
eukprot:m.127428 g.127428  ORF g.127428 m.127428 type:complete len:492 (+) comp29272_c0_seq1:100-1575(+)